MARVLILGGGISGLTAAWHLRNLRPEDHITVLEAAPEPGGCARSRNVDGFTVDLGPNGFLTNVPSTLDLALELGLADDLLPADDRSNKRLLAVDGRLVPMPLSPPAFLKTPLLSPLGKLRVLLEPLIPYKADDAETVFDFVARRLGREFAEAFILPMILGITAGDARDTSLVGLLPRMRQMEAEYGSLFGAMLIKQLQRRNDPQAPPPSAAPAGRLTSFQPGAGLLTTTLANRLGDAVRCNTPAAAIQRLPDNTWAVTTAHGDTLEADALILALPAHASAQLLHTTAPPLAQDLAQLRAADIRVLALGFNAADLPRPLDGFGFLVKRGQHLRLLGCLWTSAIFPSQAPPGRVLLRTMWGGPTDPEIMDLSTEALTQLAAAELGLLMGLSATPVMVQDIPWRSAIPQYAPNHRATVRRIERTLEHLPGLYLTGNAFRGVGLNDCTRDARLTAVAAATLLQQR